MKFYEAIESAQTLGKIVALDVLRWEVGYHLFGNRHSKKLETALSKRKAILKFREAEIKLDEMIKENK